MELRSFRASDLDILVQIDQECFPVGISYSREELVRFISQPQARTWVAVEGDEVVGFLVADRVTEQLGHIVTIDVVEACRGRGFGRRLMDAAEAWAKALNLRLMSLETAQDNHRAQQFYEARGYEKLKRLRHYYTNGTDAWVMVKHLKNAAPCG
jgi:[ribosomal protein S18]-alanine N-acetyltransferase